MFTSKAVELVEITLRTADMKGQSADPERAFSRYGRIRTKSRSRLHDMKAANLAMVSFNLKSEEKQTVRATKVGEKRK